MKAMNVRDLLQRLLDHAVDGRGAAEPVLIRCDGQLRTISDVQVRVADTDSEAPTGLFVLVVADGTSETVEASPYSPHQ